MNKKLVLFIGFLIVVIMGVGLFLIFNQKDKLFVYNQKKQDNYKNNKVDYLEEGEEKEEEDEKKNDKGYYLMKKAIKKKDDKYCLEIGEDKYDQCVYGIAVTNNDESFCQKIRDNKLQTECFDNFSFQKIKSNSDIEQCLNLKVEKFKNQCLKEIFLKYEDVDECSNLSQNEKKLCEDIVYRKLAITKHDKNICSKILDENIKENCLLEIKENNPLPDHDDDGLLDQEELSYGTDPFSPDTDGDGLLDKEELMKYHTDPRKQDTDGDGYNDGEEVKNGYNPLGEGKL